MDRETIGKMRKRAANIDRSNRSKKSRLERRWRRQGERAGKRIQTFGELTERNRKLDQEFEKIHKKTSSPRSSDWPWIVLSKPTTENGIGILGKMGHASYACRLRLYSVSEATFRYLTNKPANRLGAAYFDKKEVLSFPLIQQSYDTENSIDGLAGELTSERVFSPIGALRRAVASRQISRRLDEFEETLALFNEAIDDPELNPHFHVQASATETTAS